MWAAISDSLSFLQWQSFGGLFTIFWFFFLFELPKYGLSFLIVALFPKAQTGTIEDCRAIGRISVIIAGHNEEDAVEHCVRSLWAQSLQPDEIIVVSDGSTDRMLAKLSQMRRQDLIQGVHGTELRAGKSAATNLAERHCSGDIVINVDCDCSFDRHALKQIVLPFSNPAMGAVSGNILVRGHSKNILSSFQAIEYLISISLGKQALAMLDQVTCASGAFSAFRRSALQAVGGLDSGGGEDLDVTLRLRQANWKIGFSSEAICYTDPPSTLMGLIRQRFRWERDAVRLRYRKHVDMMNPFSKRFRPLELFHELEFLIFNVVAAAALPIYLLWLFATYGDLASIILISAQLGFTALDLVIFAIAAHATPKAEAHKLFPFILGYSVLYSLFMRSLRLVAYVQEWIFRASYKDTYVPDEVHIARE